MAVLKNTVNIGDMQVTGNLTANGYIKNGSSNSYVLLGGGGHRAIATLLQSGLPSLTTSGVVFSNTVSELGTNNNNLLTWTKGGVTNTITIPYATNASNLAVSTMAGGTDYYLCGFNGTSGNLAACVKKDWAKLRDGRLYIASMTASGSITVAGEDSELQLKTSDSSSNNSACISFYYGNGREKAKIWMDDTYVLDKGPNYRVYSTNGTQLYSGRLATVGELGSYLSKSGGTMTGSIYVGTNNADLGDSDNRWNSIYSVTSYASGGFFQSSDVRKKNVLGDLDLNKAYELIDKCQTILYTLKDDPSNKQEIGLIAQEVKEFFPEIISENKDGELSLDYSRLTVVILKVLKDLILRISEVERKLK